MNGLLKCSEHLSYELVACDQKHLHCVSFTTVVQKCACSTCYILRCPHQCEQPSPDLDLVTQPQIGSKA